MFNPFFHLSALVCDSLSSGGLQGRSLARDWHERFLDAIVHPSDVTCDGGCLYVVAELCSELVGAASGCLLDVAPSSPESL